MDFQDIEEETLPNANSEQNTNDSSETDNSTTEESHTKLEAASAATDGSTDMTNCSDGNVSPQQFEPIATTSKSKQVSVTTADIKNKGIKEFVRILRPHLSRKSKTKAYKLMQNIAKGIMVENTPYLSSRVRQTRAKKRQVRKPKAIKAKLKVAGGIRKRGRGGYGSIESSMSSGSCPRCGFHCCYKVRGF